MENYYKIYRYIEPVHQPLSPDIHPGHIIFPDSLNRNLPKKTNILLGERRQSIYYDRYENEKYTDPVIKIDYSFKRDGKGLVKEKLRTISWQLEDDSWSSQVQTDVIPVVSEAEKLQEIKRRRANIIDELKGLGKKYSTEEIPLEEGILYIFEENQLLINSYIDAGSAKFRDAISSGTERTSHASGETPEGVSSEWLDVVIPATGNKSRDVLVQYLSIGLAR